MGRTHMGMHRMHAGAHPLILYAVLTAAIILAALFVFAAGRVSAEECCQCPYECPEHRAEYPEP